MVAVPAVTPATLISRAAVTWTPAMAGLLDDVKILTGSPSGSVAVTFSRVLWPEFSTWLGTGLIAGGRLGRGVEVSVGTAVGRVLDTRMAVTISNVSVPSFSHTCSRI